MLFFTADLHLNHSNIIGLCERPFRHVHEMNETIIQNWNAVVPQKGKVFVLGDMFWGEDHCCPAKRSCLTN